MRTLQKAALVATAAGLVSAASKPRRPRKPRAAKAEPIVVPAQRTSFLGFEAHEDDALLAEMEAWDERMFHALDWV